MCVGMVGGGGGNPALSHYYAYGWLNVGVLFVYIILWLLLWPSLPPSSSSSPPLPPLSTCLHIKLKFIYILLLLSTIQVQVLDMSLAVTVKILCAMFASLFSPTCIQHMCVPSFCYYFQHSSGTQTSALLVLQTGLELISHQTISLRSYG